VIVRGEAQQFPEQLNDALQKSQLKGLDLVFDSLSGDFFWPGFNALNPGGRLVIFGSGSLMPAGNLGFNLSEWIKLGYRYAKRPQVDLLQLSAQNKSVMGFTLSSLIYDNVEMFGDMLKRLAEMNLDAPTVGKIFDFNVLPDAIKFFQTGTNIGKVVLTVKHE